MGIAKHHDSTQTEFKAPEGLTSGSALEHWDECLVCRDSRQESHRQIISAYFQVLAEMQETIAVESELPYPKKQIEEAILQELADDPESDLRRRLEIAYVQLECFIPYSDYRIIEDFKKASLRAQEIADMGDPTSILKSVGIMKKVMGESAVDIQEKISEKMRERYLRIQEFG